VQQVGYGGVNQTNHALLWTGTAGSAVDLHPTKLADFHDSFAFGVGGGEQVGYGERSPFTSPSDYHALLWHGTADSAVDLSPTKLSGIISSLAEMTNGQIHVGHGVKQLGPNQYAQHALLWSGTADSAVDLNDLLPSDLTDSAAFSIDAAGNVSGVGLDAAGNVHAVEWVPTPEPSSGLLLISGAVLALRRRRLTP